MMGDWRHKVRIECFECVELVPPTIVGETIWDCLLALHANEHRELRLDELAWLISVPALSLQRCLTTLERHHLVTGEPTERNGQIRAVLTRDGQDLLEEYLSKTSVSRPVADQTPWEKQEL